MTNDRQDPLKQKSVLAVVLTIACLVSLFTLACACLIAGCVTVFIANEFEEFEPVTLVDTVVEIDPESLPEHPTEEDWYPIAVNVLKDKGWSPPYNLVMLNSQISCLSPAALDNLHLEFAAVDFVGFVPHHKVAVVDLDRSTRDASIWIYDAGPSLTRPKNLQFSEMTVKSHEALAIADRFGGQEFRNSVNNKCEVSLWIRDYEWGINYKESGQLTRPELRLRVNARSGKARRLPR